MLRRLLSAACRSGVAAPSRSWSGTGPRCRSIFCALSLALSSCGSEAVDTPAPDAPSPSAATKVQPIIAGEPTEPGQDDAILMLLLHHEDGALAECSATLVAKNLVLTTRHCVTYMNFEAFACTVHGEVIENPTGGGTYGAEARPDQLTFHTGQPLRTEPIAYGRAIVSSSSTTICKNDIAFVILDRDLELPRIPIRMQGNVRRGELVDIVGYGLGEDMDPEFSRRLRLRKEGLAILGVGPLRNDQDVTTVAPRVFTLGGPGPCRADSGGPALSSETGAVIGTYSLSLRADCLADDITHHYTNVAGFTALAEQAFEAAGYPPLREDEREPSACTSGNACSPTPTEGQSTNSGCALGRRGPQRRLTGEQPSRNSSSLPWLGVFGLTLGVRARRMRQRRSLKISVSPAPGLALAEAAGRDDA
ncbi:MAG TPA: trypsin-like serine protease [Polyangiaceae bacterium]|nr:trypsin-like serine protease [Polyangiaceae bacterium]